MGTIEEHERKNYLIAYKRFSTIFGPKCPHAPQLYTTDMVVIISSLFFFFFPIF